MGKGGMAEKVLQRRVRMAPDCIPMFLDIIRDSESVFRMRFEGHLREIWRRLPRQDLSGCCKKFTEICSIDAK
jgi:hypothetical protein